MHTLLIVLIAYGSLGLISANIPASTIDADLAEIDRLSQDFRRASPDVARQFTEASCQMISQCCPQIRSTFASMSLSGNTEAVLEQCFGKKDSSSFLSKLMSCPPFTKITTLSKNPEFTKFAKAISKSSAQNTEDMKLTVAACSEQEMYSTACDWNRSDLQRSCQRKILQKLAEQGDNAYTNKVKQTKENYMNLAKQLKAK